MAADKVKHGYVLVPLWGRGGHVTGFTKVDADVAEVVSRYRWRLSSSQRVNRRMRYAVHGSGPAVWLHRLILGLSPDDRRVSDHMNHDGLDNRRGNLRIATMAENNQNVESLPGSSSRYRGVTWDRDKRKWKAQVTLKRGGVRRHVNIGRFDDERQAAEAVDAYRLDHLPGALPDPQLAVS